MRKAEVSTSFLVSIFVVLIGGVFIFLVYSLMFQSVDIDRETCRTSVMLRSSAPEKYIFSAKDAIDLSCAAKEICVSDNLIFGGDCKNVLGEKYTSYKINKFDNNPEDKLKSLYAREMAECWNLMGRGEGQVFAGDSKSQNCVVCSIISLQDSVKEKVKEDLCVKRVDDKLEIVSSLNKNCAADYVLFENVPGIWDLNRYFYTHKVPGQEVSYARYIYDSDITTQDFADYLVSKEKSSFVSLENTKAVIFTQDIYDVHSSRGGMTSGGIAGFLGGCIPGALPAILGGLVVDASTGFLTLGSGAIVGGVVGCIYYGAQGAVLGSAIGGTLGSGDDAEFNSAVLLVDYTPESLENLGCRIQSYS